MAAPLIGGTFMCRCTKGRGAWTAGVARLAIIGLLILLLKPGSDLTFAQTRFPYEPFDEAGDVPELLAVRAALIDAILRHDVPTVSRLLAPDFDLSAGGPEAAMRAFQKMPGMFTDLLRSLAFGGGFVDRERSRFCAPYWYVKHPGDLPVPAELQPEEGFPLMVILAAVPVYEQRSRSSRIVGRVGLELVRPALGGAPLQPGQLSPEAEELAPIVFNGKVAYVESEALRDPDARVAYGCFERRNGEWLLAAFRYR